MRLFTCNFSGGGSYGEEFPLLRSFFEVKILSDVLLLLLIFVSFLLEQLSLFQSLLVIRCNSCAYGYVWGYAFGYWNCDKKFFSKLSEEM
jgi:hypothetical protein